MIDLHTHTSASDGSLTPEALVALAEECGLGALAITDHDTMGGIERAAARARGGKVRLIPGVELEIASESGELHLLGLGLEGDRAGLLEALVRLRRDRHDRNLRMVARLAAAGMLVSYEELEAVSGGGVISRAHFGRLLVRKGIARSTEDAFGRLIGKGKPYYEGRRTLELPEAVRLIGEAGGVAVVAHPLSIALPWPALRQALAHYRDSGVRGVEAWHPNATPRDCRRLEQMARGLGMGVTAGSDFHGSNIPTRRLGHTSGGRPIEDRFLAVLRRAPA